jgi:hypothetical protein
MTGHALVRLKVVFPAVFCCSCGVRVFRIAEASDGVFWFDRFITAASTLIVTALTATILLLVRPHGGCGRVFACLSDEFQMPRLPSRKSESMLILSRDLSPDLTRPAIGRFCLESQCNEKACGHPMGS